VIVGIGGFSVVIVTVVIAVAYCSEKYVIIIIIKRYKLQQNKLTAQYCTN